MSFRFDRRGNLILVEVRLDGPVKTAVVPLVLDTGATCTLISAAVLAGIGLDPARARRRALVTTGSGVELAHQLVIPAVTALGRTRRRLTVVCHTLPTSAGIDGLLGLDFLRGTKLAIDFRKGRLDLA